jgi:RNA polymerase sigma factor (sigma-70 family)
MEPAPAAESLPDPPPPACGPTPLPAAAPLTLAALFEAEEGPLLSFALGLVGRRSVAEDLVQEAFLRLHQVWTEVENPRAWLYRSLRNLALNHLRDHRRETEMPTEEPPNDDAVPAEDMGRKEAVGVVRMLLAELPAEDGELIRLKYGEDLKYHEIGQRTGLQVGTVGYKLHHLLKGLADSLRRAGVEGSNG